MPDIIERNAKCARQLLEAGATIERLRKALMDICHLGGRDDLMEAHKLARDALASHPQQTGDASK